MSHPERDADSEPGKLEGKDEKLCFLDSGSENILLPSGERQEDIFGDLDTLDVELVVTTLGWFAGAQNDL